jgi:predicted TIM-barrel fold metal-dependent hydrolase
VLTRRNAILYSSSAVLAAALPAPYGRAAAVSTVKTPINFEVPRGSCDCHVHVLDPDRFPYLPQRPFTPAPATVEDLRVLARGLRVDRVVLVQPVHYGTNNSCLLDAARQLAPNARALAIIDQSTPRGVLEELAAGGFRGARLNFETFGVADPSAIKNRIDAVTEKMRDLKWHLHFFSRPSVIAQLHGHLIQQPLPVVIDHFAGAQAAEGPDQAGFDSVIDMVKTGHAYVKLSAPYLVSKNGPDYADTEPLALALIRTNPERVLWGSDWPHFNPAAVAGKPLTEIAPYRPIDDGLVFNQLSKWVPDQATRRKILVENPERLYGFQAIAG